MTKISLLGKKKQTKHRVQSDVIKESERSGPGGKSDPQPVLQWNCWGPAAACAGRSCSCSHLVAICLLSLD